MKFSLAWISDHVDLSGVEPAELGARLTEVGLAVELISTQGDDTIFDIDITTNRPDAMSHRGVAREIAAILDRDLRPVPRPFTTALPTLPPEIVTVAEPSLCPRYASRLLSDVTVGPSPAWLVTRLEAIGLRPINNVVDATNYVLWELGHPLHAFDRALLEKGVIVVRRARAGETIVTLDGETKNLSADMLVIADATKPVAVAGVMGGEHSGVTEATKNLLLESAWFDPRSIRRTSKQLAMHTDASHRFERGADWDAVIEALDAVTSLIQQLAGGKVLTGRLDIVDEDQGPKEKRVTLRASRIARVAGCAIPDGRVSKILSRLALPATVEGESWIVDVPRRRVDLEIEDDLVEEILRLFGYDNIPSVLPAWPPSEGNLSMALRREQAVRESFLSSGLDEVVTFSFVAPDEDLVVAGEAGAKPLALSNPLAETQSLLRTTLLSSLLPAAAHNVRHGRREVAIFEVGRAFVAHDDGTHLESRLASFVIGGRWPHSWHGRKGPEFADGKGIVESVLERLGADEVDWRPSGPDRPVFAEGRAALAMGKKGEFATVGELAPHVLHHFDLGGTWIAGEIRLGTIVGAGAGSGSVDAPVLPAPPASFAFRAFSRFPAVDLDLTIEHDRSRDLRTLLDFLERQVPETGGVLERVALKDRYEGKGVTDGKVRTTLSFVYRRSDRSLTQDEIRPIHDQVVERLLAAFDARRA